MTTPTNLPVGVTAIADRATGNELKPNADGSVNVQGSFSPAADQRVNAQAGDFVAGSITDLTSLNTAFGGQGDSVATTDTGSFSFLAFVKRTLQKLTSIASNTNAFLDTSATGTVTNDGDVVSIALPGGQATAIVNVLMGTLVGTLLFEASPDSGTTWVSVVANLSGGSTSGTSTTAAGVWRCNVSGYTNFRVRLHPTTSGTSGTITVRLSQGVHNVFINNASTLGQQTKANSSSVAIASDQIVPINGGYADLPTTVTGLSNGATVVAQYDVSGYTWGCFQATGTYSMTLAFQGSMDGTTWDTLAWQQQKTTTAQTLSSSYGSAGQIYVGPLSCKYFRVLVSGYTSNTSLNAYCRVFANAPGQLQTQAPVTVIPTTTGGTTDFHLVSAATTNGTVAKASAGMLYGYEIGNNGATDAWVKIYNKATTPTVGTDTVFRTIYVPKGSPRSYISTVGITLGTGISLGITGGAADNDTTAVGAAQVTVDLDYK